MLDHVVLKMRCNDKTGPDEMQTAEGPKEIGHLTLGPVYADSAENKIFFAATPSCTAQFWTVNKLALDFFEPNEEYYVTFTKATREG